MVVAGAAAKLLVQQAAVGVGVSLVGEWEMANLWPAK